jgi:hypothetical protein
VKNVSLFGAPLGEKASAESVNEPSVSIQDKNKMASFIGPEISKQKQIAIPALKEGIWLIVSPRYPDKQMKVLLKSVGEHRYRLTPDSFLYAGVYEQRKDTLVMVEPVSHDYNDFVWTIKDADHLELTNTEWSDYIGATLSRDISQ